MKKNVKFTTPIALSVLLIAQVAINTGCSDSTGVEYRQNIVYANSKASLYENEEQVNVKRRQEIANILVALFGTPDEPIILPELGLNAKLIQAAAGKSWSRDKTFERGLYRKHCVHCHGVSGDGKGPTAIFTNPYPRDYRQGVFKFKANLKGDVPIDEDLARTIHEGLNGTLMPSFKAILSETETDALVEYVKFLSIRGQTEIALIDYLSEAGLEDEEAFPTDEATLIGQLNPSTGLREGGILSDITVKWKEAKNTVIKPEVPMKDLSGEENKAERLASINRGRVLFTGKGQCFTCHGVTALGDGQVDFDEWNKPITEDDVNNLGALPKIKLRPRNLRLGYYRGGHRPLDIYRKIRTGIGGTPMTGVNKTQLSDEEAWDLIRYVLNLPYEPASQPRKKEVENKRTP